MKVPGTPGRKFENPMSPTFREEDILEKREKDTEQQQAKDLVSIMHPGHNIRECANMDYSLSKLEYEWPSLLFAV
jgi:hypothetical protein